MKYITFLKPIGGLLLVVMCMSCLQKQRHVVLHPPTYVSKSAKQKPIVKDSLPVYDSTVYDKYVDPSVRVLMQKYLPGWHFPAPGLWDRLWFTEYNKEGFLVDYIYADFNGDGKTDYAFLLMNKKKYAVWVLQSVDSDYKPIKLLTIGDLKEATINIGIELCPKGQLDYLNLENDNTKPIDLKNPAITIQEFESMAETYYWEDGKYKSVTTGD